MKNQSFVAPMAMYGKNWTTRSTNIIEKVGIREFVLSANDWNVVEKKAHGFV